MTSMRMWTWAGVASFWAAAAMAQPMHYWTWEGADWQKDRIGNLDMSNIPSDGTVNRLLLPQSGPGSAFPDPIPLTGNPNIFGIDTSVDSGFIRTDNSAESFNRDSFTVEVFFNPNAVSGTSNRRFFDISTGNQMARGLIRNGRLGVRLYRSDLQNDFSNIESNLTLVANRDYYTAIAVSVGPNPEDGFVDFYLQDLTAGGPLQHQRVTSLGLEFTSLNHRPGGHSLRIGRDQAFNAIGDVRYSAGVLTEAELLMTEPEMVPPRLTALGFDPETGDFTLSYTAMPDRLYQLAVSDDLVSWSFEGNLMGSADSEGKIHFSDSQASGLNRRFYRMSSGQLSVTMIPYYLSADALDVRVDLFAGSLREAADIFRLELHQGGSMVETKDVSASRFGQRIVLPSHKIGEGAYELVARVLDGNGSELSRISLDLNRPIPWWVSNPPGVSAFVPPPFDPIQEDDGEVTIIGRVYTFESDHFLPRQMVAEGEALFASPPRLVASVNGQAVALTGTLALADTDPEHVIYEFAGHLGPIPVSATTRIEFDGFIMIDLDLDSAGHTVDSLRVEFPVDQNHAELYTVNAYYDERAQRPRAVDPLPPSVLALSGGLPRAGSIGDGFTIGFNHAVWIGTGRRGFQWCAETAEHWSFDDRAESIEVLPGEEPGVTLFRLRVIDKPIASDRLTYQWGLGASPVKPYGTGGQDFYYGQTGEDFRNLQTTDPQERIDMERRFVEAYQEIGAQWYNIHSNWNADHAFGQPFREAPGLDVRSEFNDWLQAEGFRTTWYSGWNALHPALEMFPYYGVAMRRIPTRFDFDGYKECARGGYIEYLTGGTVWMIQNIGADGIYADSTSGPEPCYEEMHGCGFVDPKTGQRVVTRDIFARRELFKRLYKIFHGEVMTGGLVYAHDGWAPNLGIMSFTDINYTAEGAMEEDLNNLDRYRAQYNGVQYGLPVEHSWRNPHVVDRNHLWGLSMVHGNRIKMYPWRIQESARRKTYAEEAGIDYRMWAPAQWFNWDSPWAWHPYYENGHLLQVDAATEVVASFHVNDQQQVSFVAFNNGEEAAGALFNLDVQQLDLPSVLYALDVVTEETFQFQNGMFFLDFHAKRPRILVMSPNPIQVEDL